MRLRFYARIAILVLFASTNAATAADVPLTTVISTVCGSGMSAELTARCDAARIIAIDQAIQLGAVDLAPAPSAQLSLSATAALQKQADLIQSVMGINSATLAAIRPNTVILPDMTAVTAASLLQGMQESARTTAASLRIKLDSLKTSTAVCPAARPLALVFVNQELGDLRKAYFQARDSTEGMRDHIRNVNTFLNGFQHPAVAYPPPAPVARKIVASGSGPDGPEQTSFTAAVTGAGLLLDLVGKGAALAASFRPLHSSGSSTVTGDVQAIAQTALVGELASLGYPIIHTESIVAPEPMVGPDSLRHQLRQLRTEAFQLRQKTAILAEYNYVGAANRAGLNVPKVGADGKPLSKTDQSTLEQAERDYLVAEATTRQAILTRTVADIGTLTRAAEDLNTMIFSGSPAKDQTPATPPLVTSYDKWEKAQLANYCVVTLSMRPGSAQVDKLAVQSTFGSPKYHYKVTGAQPWMLAGERGEVLAAGTMTTSASWVRFGPTKD